MQAKPRRDDRSFFELVQRAAFSNPFGPERESLDREIATAAPTGGPSEQVEAVVAAVEARLRSALPDRRTLRSLPEDDRSRLQTAILFVIFHRFRGAFDDLILRQQRAGDEVLPSPFVADTLRELMEAGFAPSVAASYVGLFYQIRRAFYFIDQGLTGRSRPMQQLRMRLWQNVFTGDTHLYERHLWNRMEDFSTLLLGETGCGKGAAAAAVGRSGLIPYDENKGRFARSFTPMFTPINLSQYPEALIESELFGHRKGAFTGAIADHEGVFARSTPHGVLFLDEIGDASIPVQIKLLNVLQERQFSPVGSHEARRFHGRVIAATNRPVSDLRRTGRFRDDFYYRLSSDVLHVPSLRERLSDTPGERRELLGHITQRMLGRPVPELAERIDAVLERALPADYPWPGNVRELEQAARRVLLTGGYEADQAPRPLSGCDPLESGIASGSLEAKELLALYCARLHRQLGTYELVAKRTGLDRRTAKKYADAGLAIG